MHPPDGGQNVSVPFDLLITRDEGSEPIPRHTWFTLAVDTVALVQIDPRLDTREGIEPPAFGLLHRFNHPVLFWKAGRVVVKYADDEYLEDLRVIARRLGAEVRRVEQR